MNDTTVNKNYTNYGITSLPEVETCTCDVPAFLHGTSCGWDNARVLIRNGETTIVSNMTGEEKKERYLQSITEKFCFHPKEKVIKSVFDGSAYCTLCGTQLS